MWYLCYNRSVIYKEDSLYTNMNTNIENGGATGAPLVWHLPAQEASRNGVVQQENMIPNTRMSVWTAVQLEYQQFITYMLKEQAMMDIPVQQILKLAVRLEDQQLTTYILEKQAVMDGPV